MVLQFGLDPRLPKLGPASAHISAASMEVDTFIIKSSLIIVNEVFLEHAPVAPRAMSLKGASESGSETYFS